MEARKKCSQGDINGGLVRLHGDSKEKSEEFNVVRECMKLKHD
jgi:hypothetical protein